MISLRMLSAVPILLSVFNLFRVSCGNRLKLEYDSVGKPEFYMGDTLKLRCVASEFTQLRRLIVRYISRIDDELYTGCYAKKDDSWALTSIIIDNLPTRFTLESERWCVERGDFNGFQISNQLTISPEVDGARLYCEAQYRSNNGTFAPITSASLNISNIRVHPSNLTLKFDRVIKEDQEVGFECSSSDANSTYVYEVVRDDIAISDVTYTRSYIPVKEDRRGLTVIRCSDSFHPNWKGIGAKIDSDPIFAYYIDYGRSEVPIIYLTLNPIFENSLVCGIIGHPLPTFTWVRRTDTDNITLETSEETPEIFNIPISVTANGKSETIFCTGSVAELPASLAITRHITWVIPTKIVAIVVGVLAGIIIIFAIATAAFLRDRRQINEESEIVHQKSDDEPLPNHSASGKSLPKPSGSAKSLPKPSTSGKSLPKPSASGKSLHNSAQIASEKSPPKQPQSESALEPAKEALTKTSPVHSRKRHKNALSEQH